jgi:hypothetical protein
MKELDWKRDSNGALCAAAGMFHLRVEDRLHNGQSCGYVFRVINPLGDFYEGVRPDEARAIADAHHAAELLSGGAI